MQAPVHLTWRGLLQTLNGRRLVKLSLCTYPKLSPTLQNHILSCSQEFIAEARLNGRPLLEPILLVGSIAEFVVNLLFLTQMRDTSLFGADWTAASQTPLRASGTTKQLT